MFQLEIYRKEQFISKQLTTNFLAQLNMQFFKKSLVQQICHKSLMVFWYYHYPIFISPPFKVSCQVSQELQFQYPLDCDFIHFLSYSFILISPRFCQNSTELYLRTSIRFYRNALSTQTQQFSYIEQNIQFHFFT